MFGPDGRNIQKRYRYTAFKRVAPGRYEQELLSGPGSYEQWDRSWRALRVCLLVHQASRVGPLDSYESHLRRLADRYKEYWV